MHINELFPVSQVRVGHTMCLPYADLLIMQMNKIKSDNVSRR